MGLPALVSPYFLVKENHQLLLVVPKSFSYAQNKLSERSEETLLKPIEKSNGLEKVKKECPTAISNSSRAPYAIDINSTSL